MSFLSDFSGGSSYSIITGLQPIGNTTFGVNFSVSAGGTAGYVSVATNLSGNYNLGAYYNTGGGGIQARGFTRVVGRGPYYGTALYESRYNGNINLDFRGTTEVSGISFCATGGISANFVNGSTGDAALTSFYNTSWSISAGGQLTWILSGYSSLANVTCVPGGKENGCNLDFRITSAALTAQSVENILVYWDQAISSANTTSINLTGGTSSGASGLTAAASAARSSLISKGATISLNP